MLMGDPGRWLKLALAGISAVVMLTVPSGAGAVQKLRCVSNGPATLPNALVPMVSGAEKFDSLTVPQFS